MREDFGETSQAISDNTEDGFYGAADPGWYIGNFAIYARQHGELLYTEDGELGFSEETLTDWWTMTQE
jgi:multiple sugar transport system substrate-binding protein